MARSRFARPEAPNPSGVCQCGCGQSAPIATMTSHKYGWVQGEPVKFIRGHAQRVRARRPDDFLGPEYIVDEHGCHVWQHARIANIYGQTKDKRYAHRVAYEEAFGPIPNGMHLDHLCQNTLCRNPCHLEAVPPSENTRRMMEARKGLRPPRYPTC